MQDAKDKYLCINDPNATIRGNYFDPGFEQIIILVEHCKKDCASEEVILEFW